MKHMKTFFVLTTAALVVSGGLTGCGLKGDLYLPEEQSSAIQTEAPDNNAPAATSEEDTAAETLPTP